ncbi:MAG: cyclic nucleotide-binding domain-containing protein [Spirochaetaceae bacterium]|jgi:CRP-like cAMP-binding protein|nr:cyclic nucleotide-binding domain-containing protein [Spirochaetaceae bacterium]
MVEPARLQKYSLFGGLLEEQIRHILPLLETEDYGAAEDIIIEGAPNDRIRFILEGRVAVLKNNITLYEFGEGDTVGEMEVLDVMPSAATIRTLVNTKVLSISNRALRDVYKTDIHSFSLMIMNLARDLSRRLRHMNDRLIEKSL